MLLIYLDEWGKGCENDEDMKIDDNTLQIQRSERKDMMTHILCHVLYYTHDRERERESPW